ncbi:MAG: DUF2920 family protein [Planctomycetaceae bacterium]
MYSRILPVLLLTLVVAADAQSAEWPPFPHRNAAIEIPAQAWKHRPGPRTVRISIHYPGGSLDQVTSRTGLMLTLHNWGGTDCAGTANPDTLANRLNVVAICINYLQSGREDSIAAPEPYDFGYLQALDALRGLYFVFQGLTDSQRPFDSGRVFATGGSGGGNVALMCNKLAPRTFACVIDMCGMARLSDDIAYGEPGGSGLNARWSRDPDSANYLSPADQQIRFVAHPDHLAVMKRLKNPTRVIVVHGRDDRTCPFADKVQLVENMQTAGLDIESHFLSQDDLDGSVFTSSGHALGNRTEIVFRVAADSLAADGPASLRIRRPNDFQRRDTLVGYPVEGGEFVISYARGYPVGYLIKNAHGHWPPALSGVTDRARSVTVTTDRFLTIPTAVTAWMQDPDAAPFVVARQPPAVDLAYHQELGPDPARRRLWSSWGDIAVAADGRVYCGIGDHGDDAGGDARCFLYCWDPPARTLTQIVDMNQVVPPQPGQPAWSKVHAKIDQAADGKIYFSCTLNAGQRAGNPNYRWTRELPGAQLYCYDPATGATRVAANLPPGRCTATSRLDRARNLWWCHLEAGQGDALYGLNLSTGQVVFQSTDGAVAFNRNFALLRDGSILFNATAEQPGLLRSPAHPIQHLNTSLPGSPGMRCSTRESRDQFIYGCTHGTHQLFRFHTGRQQFEQLGSNWLTGQYTTVMVLSPDGRFVYYLPGAHGKAFLHGTPVIQYEIAANRRKVIAFLAAGLEENTGFIPGGTYGIKLSSDGSTLYVNFNGHAAESLRPSAMRPIGFGLCAFTAVHIPASER